MFQPCEVAPVHLGLDETGRPSTLQMSEAVKHGLVIGATGAGKTVSLQVLIEGFITAGVPVIATDIKNDLSGMAQLADQTAYLTARRQATFSVPRLHAPMAVHFWDFTAERGAPFRISAAELGANGLAPLLDLNGTQTSILSITFDLLERAGLVAHDIETLRSALTWMAAHPDYVRASYGHVAPASIGALTRKLVVFSVGGGADLIGRSDSLISTTFDPMAKAAVHLVAANKLIQTPTLYAAFCYWLLVQLFRVLPEVGVVEKPRLVIVLDEAHLLFRNAPPHMLAEVERVIRLIRSRGVAILLSTQQPSDIPRDVISQLGNRFVHALRCFTPADRAALRAVSDGFGGADATSLQAQISHLETGGAIISCLEQGGVPAVARHVVMRPPCSVIGALDNDQFQRVLAHQRQVHRPRPVEHEDKLGRAVGDALSLWRKKSAQISTKLPYRSTQTSLANTALPPARGRNAVACTIGPPKPNAAAAGYAVGARMATLLRKWFAF